jgi:outer membrane murein-binding lipoprotein Lpp
MCGKPPGFTLSLARDALTWRKSAMLFKHHLGYGKFFSVDGEGGGGGTSASGDEQGGDGEQNEGAASGEGSDAGESGDDTDGDSTDEVGKLTESVTKLETTLKKERADRKAAQREIARLQGELDAAGTNDHSAEIDEWKGKYRDEVARNLAMEEATALHAISPKAVYGLIRDKVTLDDDGNVANVKELVEALKADDPALFRAAGGTADGGATGGKLRHDDRTPTLKMANAYEENQRKR